MLQEFLRTASDGWELALTSARNLFAEADLHADEVGGDFAGEAHRLGIAVSEVHDLLRQEFGTQPYDAAATAAAMRQRLAAAEGVVPALADHRSSLEAVFSRVSNATDDAQRVHGDLHLGQTLRTSLGWKLVDFEGEPAKPLAERRLPDSAWRDVAGMLRSFDYAAQSVVKDLHSADAPGLADQLPGQGVAGAQPRRLPRGLRRTPRRGGRGAAQPRRGGDDRRLRGRQGRLRGHLRSTQPSQLGGHPAAGNRPDRSTLVSEPLIGELDVHLINEGRHEQLWDALGAHVIPDGTAFRVWAPQALEVQVRGDFNGWDGASA